MELYFVWNSGVHVYGTNTRIYGVGIQGISGTGTVNIDEIKFSPSGIVLECLLSLLLLWLLLMLFWLFLLL